MKVAITADAAAALIPDGASQGRPQIVPLCTLPLTATRRVSLVVTEMAVIEPTEAGLVLRERGPGVSVGEIEDATGAALIGDADPPEMALG
jgi:acetate CoA/acetoacetate CoA-transferase beta subunit